MERIVLNMRMNQEMQETFSWSWVEAQAARTIDIWNECAAHTVHTGSRYCADEQQRREKAYDRTLQSVEREVKKSPRTRMERLAAQRQMTSSFARFSAAALDLEDDAVHLLTDDFLPVGTRLARWARRFDESLSMAEIVQASRNAWTACGLQALLGESVCLTPSILGYSLLYPYTDNFLDRADLCADEKRRFSERFRQRLGGEDISAETGREAALWALVGLIEGQYPRERYAQVFDCLLAIHRAQEGSIAQLENSPDDAEVLRISCSKGGSSVLADACLVRGCLNEAESQFAFDWGVLLQLGDDLQDVREDLQRGSVTLFSRAAALGVPLDSLALQLLGFSEQVGKGMDDRMQGTAMLKNLLRTSWRSLIVGAVADSHEFFSPELLKEMERSSPFRFDFLRARRRRLASREGLFAGVFSAFLDGPDEDFELPVPTVALVEF
jgi:hypothetical protein